MIRTIVFDIGNVLAAFAWQQQYASYNLDKQQYERIVRATIGSGLWAEFDRAVLTNQQVIDLFCQYDPVDEEMLRKMFSSMHGYVRRYDYAVNWIKEYKQQGLQVYYLSNMNEAILNDCQEAFDFLPYLDGGIYSYEVKLVKPDEAIYQCLIAKYDLKPDECIFIDDNQNNLITAESLGFHTVLCKDYLQARKQIQQIMKQEE